MLVRKVLPSKRYMRHAQSIPATVVSSQHGTALSRDRGEQINSIKYSQARNQCLCSTYYTVYSSTAVQQLYYRWTRARLIVVPSWLETTVPFVTAPTRLVVRTCWSMAVMVLGWQSRGTDLHPPPNKKTDISTTTRRIKMIPRQKERKPDVGLEPATLRLRVSRATDCASRAWC